MGRDPVPNVFNSKQSQDIIMELCARIGILDKYYGAINDMGVMLGEVTFAPIPDDMKLDVTKRHTVREMWDIGIKSRFGRQHSFEEVLENGFLYQYEPLNECYNSHYYKKGEYRHPVYFDRLVRTKERIVELFENNPINVPGYDYKLNTQHYEPLVTWRENPVNTAGTSKSSYELVAFNFKIPFTPFRVGAVDQLPWLNEAGEKYEPYYNTIHINSATAARLGFKTGDTITVESENGHVTGRLITTELVHPQAVGIGGSLGRVTNAVGPKAASYMHYNRLTNAKLDNTDPISGGVINNVPVKLYKGGK